MHEHLNVIHAWNRTNHEIKYLVRQPCIYAKLKSQVGVSNTHERDFRLSSLNTSVDTTHAQYTLYSDVGHMSGDVSWILLCTP